NGLLDALRDQFTLDWHGIHGGAHWARVRANGLRLAPVTGADVQVVELFAWLHDARRFDDGCDPDHGWRAAELAFELRGTYFDLDDLQFGLLAQALTGHSDGQTTGHVTVRTCWDADRLDLGRCGVDIDPSLLCTAAARDPELIAWASARSRRFAEAER
ncbi:MAG: hypothetical protein AAFZ65_18475, partial [Planctomycetota bacterium]